MSTAWSVPLTCADLLARRDAVCAHLARFSNPDAVLCARAEVAAQQTLSTTSAGKARAVRSQQNISVLLRRHQAFLKSLGVPVWPLCPIRIALFLASHLDNVAPVLKRTLASYRSDLQGVMLGMAHVWTGTAFESAYTGGDLLKSIVERGRTPTRAAKKRRRHSSYSPDASLPLPPLGVCFCLQPASDDMITCANPTCPIKSYHWRCVEDSLDDEDWLCSRCRPDELAFSPPIVPPATPLSAFSPLYASPWTPGLHLYWPSAPSPPLAFDQRALPSTPGLEVLASLCAAEPRVPTDPARYSISSAASSAPSEASTSCERPRYHPSRIWEEDDEPLTKR